MSMRKKALCSLASNDIIVNNTFLETEDIVELDERINEMLECNCPVCVEERETSEFDEELEDIPIEERDLIGRVEGDAEVVHLLYPAEDCYDEIIDWAKRIRDEYDDVELKYFKDLDAYVFYSGDEDAIYDIAENIIEDIDLE